MTAPVKDSVWPPKQRLRAVLEGQKPDRVPVSVWLHNFAREQTPDALVAETLRLQEKFEFDFIKPQSPAHSAPLIWGAEISEPGAADDWPHLTRPAIRSGDDLDQIEQLPVTGMLADQVTVMREVKKALGPDVPVIATIFTPMMTLSLMHEGGKPAVLSLMETHPKQLARALEAMTGTLADFVAQAMDAGVDGLFYASNTCNRGEINCQQHDDFHAPFDAQILEKAKGGWMNILHICGKSVQTEFFLDYEPPIISWEQTDENPTAHAMRELTGKTVLTGAPAKPGFGETRPEAIARQVHETIAEMDGRHLMIGPGCSVNPGVDEALIGAVVDATRDGTGQAG